MTRLEFQKPEIRRQTTNISSGVGFQLQQLVIPGMTEIGVEFLWGDCVFHLFFDCFFSLIPHSSLANDGGEFHKIFFCNFIF